jgi:hypothetical protein
MMYGFGSSHNCRHDKPEEDARADQTNWISVRSPGWIVGLLISHTLLLLRSETNVGYGIAIPRCQAYPTCRKKWNSEFLLGRGTIGLNLHAPTAIRSLSHSMLPLDHAGDGDVRQEASALSAGALPCFGLAFFTDNLNRSRGELYDAGPPSCRVSQGLGGTRY